MQIRLPSGRALAPLVALALVPASAQAAPSPSQIRQAAGYCQSAERALAAGNFRKAGHSLSKALQIVPGFPAAHMGLGHIALSEKRYEAALREYEQARAGYADVVRTLMQIRARDFGNAQSEIVALRDELRKERKYLAPPLRLHKLEAAIERLERRESPHGSLSEEPPASFDFYIGNALFHLNRVEEAIASWNDCIRKDREFLPAYQNLTVGYMVLGQIGVARETALRAEALGLRIDPALKADVQRASATVPAAATPN